MTDAAAAVPFFSATGAAFGVDLAACLQRVVASGHYVLGPEVRAFEAAFAHSVGVAQAVGVASGTDALVLALRALGVGAGARVVTVANAGCYASTAIAQVGATPLYLDVDPGRLTLAPRALQVALASGGVDAVIATHLYGRMADMAAIAPLCAAAQVPLIEDCAQAHGAALAGRAAGAWGTLGSFSFYPTKNLGALGDGGAVVTADAALAARLRALRQYGWGERYRVELPGGMNSRLDELQAAVLLTKLPHLAAANAARAAIAARYSAAWADLPLVLPPPAGADNVTHLYVVRTPRRAQLQAFLAHCAIVSAIHYPLPDHRQAVHGDVPAPHLPVTEQACAEVLSLPCFPGMEPRQVARVIAAVRAFFTERAPC